MDANNEVQQLWTRTMYLALVASLDVRHAVIRKRCRSCEIMGPDATFVAFDGEFHGRGDTMRRRRIEISLVMGKTHRRHQQPPRSASPEARPSSSWQGPGRKSHRRLIYGQAQCNHQAIADPFGEHGMSMLELHYHEAPRSATRKRNAETLVYRT